MTFNLSSQVLNNISILKFPHNEKLKNGCFMDSVYLQTILKNLVWCIGIHQYDVQIESDCNF
jgi:hypothetical protein